MVDVDKLPGLTDRLMGSEEAVAKAITELVEMKQTFQLSHIEEDEAKNLAYLYLLSKICKSKTLLDFIDKFLKLKVSVEGRGRRQVALISSRVGEIEPVKLKGIEKLIPGL